MSSCHQGPCCRLISLVSRMIISVVVAAGEDNSIGAKNDLMWKLPNDMRFFKNLTWGMPVVMGRKTFESMGSKPLPGRINIVISSTLQFDGEKENLVMVKNLEEAINRAEQTDCKEVFIIGGGQIYKEAMRRVDCIYMTRVHAVFPQADTFFPPIDSAVFDRISSKSMPVDERHAIAFTLETWKRK